MVIQALSTCIQPINTIKAMALINSGQPYLEHFPYLNRLWFGEYFDYEKNSPDFFLKLKFQASHSA